MGRPSQTGNGHYRVYPEPSNPFIPQCTCKDFETRGKPCKHVFAVKFVIEREIPGAGQMTEEQVRDASVRSLEILKGMGSQIQWLHSYVTDDRLYCVYLAPDEEVIREHARKLGVPANRISAVRRLIDPKRYA